MARVRWMAVGCLIWAAALPAWGQDAPAAPADDPVTEAIVGEPDEAAPEASGSEVAVEPVSEDVDIAQRLYDILTATGKFENLDVSVAEGVVFLRGTTAEKEMKTLAGDLVRRTKDAVAVVNEIQVDEGPWWDTQPAQKELRSLGREAVRLLPLLAIAAVLLTLTVLAASGISGLLARPLYRFTDSELVRNVLRKVVYTLVLIAGLYLFLRITGLTRIALGLISGTGLLGLVVGFAFRDIAENFLASLLISVQKPFRLNDVIRVDGHTGVVQAVTTRGTTLVDFDGNHIQIANSTVYKNTIVNFTANPKVRAEFGVGIGYDAGIGLAQDTILRVLEEHPAVLDDPTAKVLVEALASSTINLRVYFWVDGGRHDKLKVLSAVMRLAIRALERAGISMPDDAREVIFPDGVPVRQLDADADADARGPSAADPGGTGTAAAEAAGPRNEEAPNETAHATAAEGDLASNVGEIEKQAAASRRPEDGATVL
ncbi:mechanosensitive ion channel family protein [Phycisphaera mikurensis]|uniref:Putative MscS family protein n=1 Tax=Phycisphaera mikurensis (strain NBRC 102666 / KCTC 22515 / FYK2301M01) TaxID=1142394 RepID=I0IGH5_PHYMF|nr:mechanosensitive ion channel family protein [Phycisphaera mikurensis]MBB6442956.1 small-conductance mechanosensitive channel [Phycisphaera mikurensis]BAM04363.1 putative MscS family protein [Phycisphaera mikurensis NBRC 102666]